MARSTFYYNVKRIGQPDGYEIIRDRISAIYDTNHGRYGYRRITAQLLNEGVVINHKTVQKLMRQMNLKAKRRKQHYHSYKGEVGKVAPNILGRDFLATRPNQKWATDVTQINIHDKKLYLSPILDMFNGEIISYSVSSHPDLKLVITMLSKALRKNTNLNGLVFHSDQGWHYQHGIQKQTQRGAVELSRLSRRRGQHSLGGTQGGEESGAYRFLIKQRLVWGV